MADEIEIYIDESGDLGFGSKSSDYFINVQLNGEEKAEQSNVSVKKISKSKPKEKEKSEGRPDVVP
ncbi:MAG: hypothetical protein ACXQT4_00045 [Methanotrichaceae archaeon]